MDRIIKNKKGFGIMEVLVSAVVLGFLYMALLHLQTGNHEAMLRIRGRDGAIEVAQQVIDEMNRMGIASIPDSANHPSDLDGTVDNATGSYTFKWEKLKSKISRTWDRADNGKSTIEYDPEVTVSPPVSYTVTDSSNFDKVSHVYAKQVNVRVSWKFKGAEQSINMSTVIR